MSKIEVDFSAVKVLKRALAMLPLLFIISTAAGFTQSTPAISPLSTLYTNGIDGASMSITASTGTIYYTVDGSDPTTSPTAIQYTSSFRVTSTTQIRAATQLGSSWSSVANSVQVFDGNTGNISTAVSTSPNGPANMALWLMGVTACASAGTVNFWADLSVNNGGTGQHNDVTQSTSGNRPAIASSSVNSLPAVNFVKSSSNFMSVPSLGSLTSASIFIVTTPNTVSSGNQIINLSSSPAPDSNIGFDINSSSEAEFFVYNSSGSSPTSVAQTTAMPVQPQLLECVQSGTNATFYTNGVAAGTNSSMNAIATTTALSYIGQAAGGGNYYDGKISEIILYSAALTQAQQSSVEAYLMGKYQIATVVPSSPIISVPSSTLTIPTYVAIAAQPNSTIYYTLDGTTPSTSSPAYTGPINIYYGLTLKAIAISGALSSTVSSTTYSMNSTQWPAPGAGGPTLQISPTLPTTVIP